MALLVLFVSVSVSILSGFLCINSSLYFFVVAVFNKVFRVSSHTKSDGFWMLEQEKPCLNDEKVGFIK